LFFSDAVIFDKFSIWTGGSFSDIFHKNFEIELDDYILQNPEKGYSLEPVLTFIVDLGFFQANGTVKKLIDTSEKLNQKIKDNWNISLNTMVTF
jgi:hypothetical protein